MNRRALIGGAAAVGVLGVGGVGWYAGRRGGVAAACPARVTRQDLDQGVDLGVRYLLAAQRPTGDFVYEVDWTTGEETKADEPVRQAGAVWGLALAHLETGAPELSAALERALAFWTSTVRTAPDGRAWFVPPNVDAPLGAIALIGLALVDRLRAPADLDEATKTAYATLLDGLIRHVREARMPHGGGFRDTVEREIGLPRGLGNPYADGECLLLLSRAGVHLDKPEVANQAVKWSGEDYERNVLAPRRTEEDPDQTKGYYQWSTMAWYELAASGRDPDRFGPWILDLADWMVDVHHTLTRTRNTAYAYEGLVHAWAWARDHGDPRADKLACVCHQGLSKLLSWQLGHRLSLLGSPEDKFLGGVQNQADVPDLRIDVTQHQTHAVILARRFGLDAS